ncbi:tRNA (N(6)-L-threonylcarbamoyladenosine(37)-C(2))-methylthiotransferase MtaB [Desulfurivibrio sp. C05AmB]|uniref:tRNA (N(6)-L-threonylcarbamoyladenosine(37)-C(2))- methylthiotransferase MtaB n=1 Tax=Desulfurivibrio sp. C05AmB TaxID=3374371 RepID=UPI00376F1123
MKPETVIPMAMAAHEAKDKKRVAVTTLGCKVNQYESAAFISDLAESAGVEIVPFSAVAEVYVINTCAVTAKAGAQSRQLIRRAAKNPGARLVVTGCYAQVAAEEIGRLTDRPLTIVGNCCKERVVEEVVRGPAAAGASYLGEIGACNRVAPLTVTRFERRTRAVLKIQDGCSQGCSYCIVPLSRGPSRSVEPERVLAQAEIFAAQGFREVVLTGIHLGHYGLDLAPALSLVELLKLLLARGFPLRYRISSLEPSEIGPELLELLAGQESLLPHLHIPLQSGDDRILRAMNRPYRSADFAGVIRRCLAALPDAAIGVDVLAGFPGEDETAFRNTYELLADLPISYLHVFPYSRRPGTRAADLPQQVSGRIKDERTARLRRLDRQKRQEFYRRQLGSVRQVLVEGGAKSGGLLRGFSENYIPVLLDAPAALINQIVPVRLAKIRGEAVWAVPLDKREAGHAG